MNNKTRALFSLIALTTMFASFGLVYSQTKNSATQITVSPGQFYLVDGRASLGKGGRLYCGAGSPVGMNPLGVGGSSGPLVNVDLSFGILPFDRVGSLPFDRFSTSESFTGTWAVRNIYPAEASRAESIAAVYFSGRMTSGLISSMRGGATAFDLYGVTSLSGQVCGTEGDYNTNRDARRYVRLTGTCGNDQEVTFQLGRRPPADHGGDTSFEPADIFAYGTFRGNISCGQITDRSRVRTNLSK